MPPIKSSKNIASTTDQPIIHAIHNPPILPTLPKEILYHIISYLDPPTACAFARTARTYTSAAVAKIWYRLTLHLPENHGLRLYDVVHPVPWKERHRYRRTDGAEEARVEATYCEQLRERVRGMLMRGGERRWQTVREVVVMPRPGAIGGIIQILDLVSEELRSLEILGTGYQYRTIRRPAPDHQMLDVRMIDSRISFPSLTHIRLLNKPLRFHEFIPLICNASPNLTSLTADLDHDSSLMAADELDPPFPRFDRPTRIKVLRLDFGRDLDDGLDDEEESLVVLLDILAHCPQLEEIALNWNGSKEGKSDIAPALGALRNLKDSVWIGNGQDIMRLLVRKPGRNSDDFPLLRRIVLEQDDGAPFREVPTLPKLEVLVHLIDRSSLIAPFPEFFKPKAFIPSLARQLRLSPQLREIRMYNSRLDGDHLPSDIHNLSDVLQSSTLTGEISSYRHGDEEVLYARLLDTTYEVSDDHYVVDSDSEGDSSAVSSDCDIHYRYSAANGSQRIKAFDRLHGWSRPEDSHHIQSAVWRDYTDYKGSMVPLEVLSRMRKAQGVSEVDWRRRGIEVGDAAWKVLLDWRANPKPEPSEGLLTIPTSKVQQRRNLRRRSTTETEESDSDCYSDY